MTRKEIKELLPIMQAFADGKTIEIYGWKNKWKEVDEPSFDIDAKYYRVKPEHECRPFKSREECWDEMSKHQPFGWLKRIDTGTFAHISAVSQDFILFNNEKFYREDIFDCYTFIDGAPFGIIE